MADNYNFNLRHDKKAFFEKMFEIAFDQYKATYYTSNENELVFYWSDPGIKGAVPLMHPHDPSEAAAEAWGWLTKIAKYEQEPDHDGSNKKGYIIQNDKKWSQVNGSFYGILKVSPTWCMYGK